MIPTPLERLGLTRDAVQSALRPHLSAAPKSAFQPEPKAAEDLRLSRIEKEVRRLKIQGETVLQIARALKVTKAVVNSILSPAAKGSGGPRGEHFQSKLTENQVRNIRKRYDEGDPLEEIANFYGVTKACVSLIGSRQKRKSVED